MGPQYAFIQECQNNLFEPILWEEEDGRQLVIGFRVNGETDSFSLMHSIPKRRMVHR